MNVDDLEIRKVIWTELSDFYLDTELDEQELISKTETFKKLGVTLEQVKEVNYKEVAPLLLSNLNDIAGNWSGFDEKWLHNRIEISRREKASLSFFGKINQYIDNLRTDFYTNRYFRIIEKHMK